MKLVTLENLDRFWTHIKNNIGNTDDTTIHGSVNNPIEPYGNDGDIWMSYDESSVLVSVSYGGTTVYPLSNKEYFGVFNNNSGYINELNGTVYCSSENVPVSGFTVNIRPGFAYRFINYDTGVVDKTTTMVNVNNVPTTLLEVTHSKSLKKYLYKIVGSGGGSYGGDQ